MEKAEVDKDLAAVNERGEIVMSIKERSDICEELGVIAGILDMLFLIDVADAWSMRSENLGLVIMDTRNRALSLADQI